MDLIDGKLSIESEEDVKECAEDDETNGVCAGEDSGTNQQTCCSRPSKSFADLQPSPVKLFPLTVSQIHIKHPHTLLLPSRRIRSASRSSQVYDVEDVFE